MSDSAERFSCAASAIYAATVSPLPATLQVVVLPATFSIHAVLFREPNTSTGEAGPRLAVFTTAMSAAFQRTEENYLQHGITYMVSPHFQVPPLQHCLSVPKQVVLPFGGPHFPSLESGSSMTLIVEKD